MAGFKEFLMRGNLIDLAVAFILGASFGNVVTAFTKIGGNPDFSTVAIGGVNIGVFITAVVSFVIMAAVLYFGVVKPYETIRRMTSRPAVDEPAKPSSEDLLVEIRDLLAKK